MNKILLFAGGLLGIGCAQHPPPTEQLAKSISSVRGAQEAGASGVPEAALHVKLAQEQIAEAIRLMDDEEYQRAEDQALRAAQDAELAGAIARRCAAQQRPAGFERKRPSAAKLGPH